jgi:anti-anti-sigma factor
MQQSENSTTWVNFGDIPPPPFEEFRDRALSRRDFRTSSLNGVLVITAPAEVDNENVNQLSHAILAASADSTAVTVDMTVTIFIDCAGLGGLIRMYKLLKEDGIELRIAASYHRVRGLLAFFGADQWIRVFDTLPEAVTAMPVIAMPENPAPYRQAA